MKMTNIRLRRFNAGIEQNEAIETLGITRSTFYKVEQGHLQPSKNVIAKMSKLYKCTIDDLYKDLKIN